MSLSLLEPLRSLIGERREERLARSISLEALEGFRRLRAALPDLSKETLYGRVMWARFGVGGDAAKELIAGARESYADWPVKRDVKFCDVVHYFVAQRCLQELGPQGAHWIQGRIGRVVRDIIPQNL